MDPHRCSAFWWHPAALLQTDLLFLFDRKMQRSCEESVCAEPQRGYAARSCLTQILQSGKLSWSPLASMWRTDRVRPMQSLLVIMLGYGGGVLWLRPNCKGFTVNKAFFTLTSMPAHMCNHDTIQTVSCVIHCTPNLWSCPCRGEEAEVCSWRPEEDGRGQRFTSRAGGSQTDWRRGLSKFPCFYIINTSWNKKKEKMAQYLLNWSSE